MIRVMDGVRPGMAHPQMVVLPKPETTVKTLAGNGAAVLDGLVEARGGLDGIRRTPRPTAVAPMRTEPRVVAGTIAEVPAAHSEGWRQAKWRRPAIAFGTVAAALAVSVITVRWLTTPAAVTARAAGDQTTQQPAPSPAAAVAAATPTPAPVPQKTGLQQLLTEFVAANPSRFGIVVKDLTTGETASINPEQQMESASLYKLFVAQRIYQRIDLGQLDYGRAAGGGTGRNIQDCLRVMINVSDNACGRALGTILGWGAQDQALAIEGYEQTTMVTPQRTSAADVAMLFNRLHYGTLVSHNSTEAFMALLKDQRVNNRLPKGLPTGTVMAHKTGDLDGYVHDAGIVYGPKTNYLVVMMSGPWATPGGAAPQFADLSARLWNYFEQ